MKAGDRYEIELGFWRPIIVVAVIVAVISFTSFVVGEKHGHAGGYIEGHIDGERYGMKAKEEMIAQQIENKKLPMRADGHGYWCRRIK